MYLYSIYIFKNVVLLSWKELYDWGFAKFHLRSCPVRVCLIFYMLHMQILMYKNDLYAFSRMMIQYTIFDMIYCSVKRFCYYVLPPMEVLFGGPLEYSLCKP